MKKREFVIGISVIIALVILFFGINYLKGINIFKGANYYYVSYTNVAGLTQSAPVTINGYKVGLVREVNYEFDNPGHISVELSLDRQLRLPSDTRAVLVTDILGTTTINLIPGTSNTQAEVGAHLTAGKDLGMMDQVSSELMPTLISIAPHVDSLVCALTAIAANPALTSSVERLDVIMANLEATTKRLNESMAGVPRLVSTANSTLNNVQEISLYLKNVSSSLAVLSDDIRTMPLDSMVRHLNTISANLDQATAQLNSTESSLGLLLNDPGLYNNLNSSAAHLDSILIDVKERPRHYIPSIKVF